MKRIVDFLWILVGENSEHFSRQNPFNGEERVPYNRQPSVSRSIVEETSIGAIPCWIMLRLSIAISVGSRIHPFCLNTRWERIFHSWNVSYTIGTLQRHHAGLF